MGAINEVLFTITSATAKGLASGFVPLSEIGAALVRNGALKDYGSGTATRQQLRVVLSEIKRHGGECETKIKEMKFS